MRTTLQEEHARILALAARLRVFMANAETPSTVFAGVMRGEFVRILEQHMSFKEAMIYSPLSKMVEASRLSLLKEIEALGSALYADYEHHRAAWPQERIADRWSDYRIAVIDLLERVESTVQLEKHHIYPLLTHSYEACPEPLARSA